MITYQGIKVSPDQIRAIHGLHPPRNSKEVQCLTGMIATLSRFISRLADWCRPFFWLLYKWKDFAWSEECNKAFGDLKKYLAYPLFFSAWERRILVYLYSCHEPCNDLSFDPNRWGSTKTSLLCQQVPTGSRDSLSSFRKSHPSHHTCHKEAIPLLSGPYSCVGVYALKSNWHVINN